MLTSVGSLAVLVAASTVAARAATGTASSAVVRSSTVVSTKVGYWMLGHDGSVYGFGDARALPGILANATSIAARVDGTGYWVVDAYGDVRANGAARYAYRSPTLRPGEIIATMSATPS
ncbi:MAG TPA: hypothetical protein VN636_16545, partial [Acidimicrobiia bacterium]|nr:hypothetical protein [Acidimicrobiia bacterium]